ncbi:AMP-binding protein [Acuticoccus mangrovi]|uniref:3-methylmercaptopropionyl-CoA ligase n=1 Tax=Acuticoccus mangrovi TaxID=2796142 RepID=A0A934IS19_9HYPH|nr:AMP-binding protein [Acuticoccus mangrovi]MBJ3777711.1 AMP-binding protein [Acuticoccus mangrovi]
MDERGLEQRAANHTPQTPLSFLERTARVFPDRLALVHGERRETWAEVDRNVRRLAAGLRSHGIGEGDVVAILAPNTPAFVEANFAVPLAGAVLLTLNTRLDPGTLAYCLEHSEAKLVLCDCELIGLLGEAAAEMAARPTIARIDDPLAAAPTDGPADLAYETLFADEPMTYEPPADEWASLSLSYTSGTTGRPKGVVYSHRGAATNAVSNAVDWALPPFPVYLWTLPMFHCNGWCFPYTVAMTAGVNVCLRHVSADAILDAFEAHGVTHLCGAPIIMQMVIQGAEQRGFHSPHPVRMMTAAAPPPAVVIQKLEAIGVDVTHVYGLTEVYGPCVVSAWNPKWNGLPVEERARLKARQGVNYTLQEEVSVRDPETMAEVPWDGATIGEIMIRGNIVMKGYLKDEEATAKAFAGGYFHTGDLAVRHPDGYLEIKDRSKDIIISGGENISSIEIEDALYAHPAVAGAAVVAMPHEKWGETPCAFVELAAGQTADEAGIIAFVRERIAHYKAPRRVVFEPLPKTSTGKVQKFALRQRARELAGG